MSEDPPDPSTDTTKAPYIKPEITRVLLRPQEAVLGFCKTSSASVGPGSPTDCTLCATAGS
jgi:hypothetical protein